MVIIIMYNFFTRVIPSRWTLNLIMIIMKCVHKLIISASSLTICAEARHNQVQNSTQYYIPKRTWTQAFQKLYMWYGIFLEKK